MNKKEMVRVVAQKHGVPAAKIEPYIDDFIELMASALSVGEDVLISGFAKFSVHRSPGRMHRNPKTGEPVKSPAQMRLSVKASPVLKDRINGI